MLSDMFNSLCYRASRGFIIQENTYNMIFEGQNSISVRLPTTILSHAITCIHALRWHAITALCSDIVALSSRAITTLWRRTITTLRCRAVTTLRCRAVTTISPRVGHSSPCLLLLLLLLLLTCTASTAITTPACHLLRRRASVVAYPVRA